MSEEASMDADSNPTRDQVNYHHNGHRHQLPPSTPPVTGGTHAGQARRAHQGAAIVTDRTVIVRRVYDEPLAADGARVLVDRIWPRGISKARAHLDEWCKIVAPSTDLRKWYGHLPDLFQEFTARYTRELQDPERAAALQHLHDLRDAGPLTLLTATKNPDLSEAAVLARLLQPGTASELHRQ